MTNYSKQEEYLEKIFSSSLSSANPSKETYKKHYNHSNLHFSQFKNELLDRYGGKNFKDFKACHTIDTDFGETLEITHKENIDFKLKNNDFKKDLSSNLKLIKGIGPKTEEKLKNKGYTNLYKLKRHPKYTNKSLKIIKELEDSDFKKEFNLVKKSDSTLNTIKCASDLKIENLKFMDIETLGLMNVPVILIGIAYIKNNKIISKQYLQRNGNEEGAIISAYLSNLDEDSVHVSYNGQGFDIPFLKNRADFFGIDYDRHLHYDLLYFSRKLYKNRLNNCKLQTVESYIRGFERFNDVPGQYIPDYYKTYVESGNIGPLVPIVQHNRLDIISLADIFMRIYDDVNNL